MNINVVWSEGAVHGYCHMRMLRDMLSKYDCVYFNSFKDVPIGEGAFVVVHGGNERHKFLEIQRDIQNLPWVILAICGDEGADFPLEFISHPRMKLWLMMPHAKHDSLEYRGIPIGYTNDTKKHLTSLSGDKDLDWFFAGQITHARRFECVFMLREMSGGVLVETQGFQQGIPQEEYFATMKRAKVVPCPSGPAIPDTFRMYEALEAGCIPIADAKSINGELGYWKRIFGHEPLPFPVLENWNHLPACMDLVLRNWHLGSPVVRMWWNTYKNRFNTFLAQDLIKLGVS